MSAGKGDKTRPLSVPREVYEANYERWQRNSISRGKDLPPGFRYIAKFRPVHKGEYYMHKGHVRKWGYDNTSEDSYTVVEKDQKKKG